MSRNKLTRNIFTTSDFWTHFWEEDKAPEFLSTRHWSSNLCFLQLDVKELRRYIIFLHQKSGDVDLLKLSEHVASCPQHVDAAERYNQTEKVTDKTLRPRSSEQICDQIFYLCSLDAAVADSWKLHIHELQDVWTFCPVRRLNADWRLNFTLIKSLDTNRCWRLN